jgi:hypothetical protein
MSLLYFRGVSQDALLNSISQGLRFLTDCDIGPNTNMMISHFEKSAVVEIKTAKSEDALVGSMRKGNLRAFFYEFKDIFELPSYEDDEHAHEVFKDLASWGAFVPARADFAPVKREKLSYIIFQYLKLGSQLDTLAQRTAEICQPLGRDQDTLETILPILSLLGDSIDSRDLLDESSVDLLAQLACILKKSLGHPSPDFGSHVPSGLDSYSIVLEGEPWTEAVFSSIRNELWEKLSDFEKRDEVSNRFDAYRTPERTLFTFYSSAEAAQAAADRMPRYSFVNKSGDAIVPG